MSAANCKVRGPEVGGKDQRRIGAMRLMSHGILSRMDIHADVSSAIHESILENPSDA